MLCSKRFLYLDEHVSVKWGDKFRNSFDDIVFWLCNKYEANEINWLFEKKKKLKIRSNCCLGRLL